MTNETPKNRFWRPLAVHTVLIIVFALGACATYRPFPAESVPTPSDVRIRFEPPRSIMVHRSTSSDSLNVPDVTELRGKLVERIGDAITLEVSQAQILNARSPQRFGSGSVVRVPAQVLEVRKTDAGKTILLVAGSIAALVLLITGLTSESEPEPTPPPKDEGSKA